MIAPPLTIAMTNSRSNSTKILQARARVAGFHRRSRCSLSTSLPNPGAPGSENSRTASGTSCTR